MSDRGILFLDEWMAEHLLHVTNDDPATAVDLADQVIEAAKEQGISADEISEEVGSVFKVILDMIQRRGSDWAE